MNDIQNEFISTVSHELRTPLTSIRGFSQTLLNSWDKIDDENKKKFVSIIEEQSNRLINLVENILTVSKMNEDKPILRAVDVNSSIQKTLQMLSQKYSGRAFVSKFHSQLPQVALDDDKFQQIMTNLIDNACKYSSQESTVEISTSFKDSENVLIKIKDYGVGIDKDDLDKIFTKFTRLENHLTSKTQGNGLGLYITKNLVEAMNGSISVESEPNVGSTFLLEFPFYNQEEAMRCSRQS